MDSTEDQCSADAAVSGDPEGADDPRLTRALEEYLEGLEGGRIPDAGEFLDRHAEIAGPLAGLLRGLDLLHLARPQAPAAGVASETRLGDFRVLREVGRGGMGIVYEAEQ